MEFKHKKSSKNNRGTALIFILLTNIILSLFSLAFLNSKKTNEKVYRLLELSRCHTKATTFEITYLKQQNNLNKMIKSVSILKKIPKIRSVAATISKTLKMSQEILFHMRPFWLSSISECKTSNLLFFINKSILKRNTSFLRNKNTGEILSSKIISYLISSKYIHYGTRTIIKKKDKFDRATFYIQKTKLTNQPFLKL